MIILYLFTIGCLPFLTLTKNKIRYDSDFTLILKLRQIINKDWKLNFLLFYVRLLVIYFRTLIKNKYRLDMIIFYLFIIGCLPFLTLTKNKIRYDIVILH